MNGELVMISPTHGQDIAAGLPLAESQIDLMQRWARDSRPLFSGTMDGTLLCLVGLIPPTFLSEIVYLWCWSSPEVVHHKVMFGRHARRLMHELRGLYPKIVGHCAEDNSVAWLRSLGAEFNEPQGHLIPFEITS